MHECETLNTHAKARSDDFKRISIIQRMKVRLCRRFFFRPMLLYECHKD